MANINGAWKTIATIVITVLLTLSLGVFAVGWDTARDNTEIINENKERIVELEKFVAVHLEQHKAAMVKSDQQHALEMEKLKDIEEKIDQ